MQADDQTCDTSRSIVWLGSSLSDLRACSPRMRQLAGRELWRLQRGHAARDYKHMPDIGPGVREIRIHAETETRIIVVLSLSTSVCVLHVFTKKSERTGKRDIALARRRYAELKRELMRGVK